MQTKSVRPESLRSINIALVLQNVLSASTPPSRAQVAASVGLTRATATKLGDELVAGGILEEVPPPRVHGPGRPAQGLVGSSRFFGLGLDIGVAHQRAIAINLRGQEIARAEQHLPLASYSPKQALPGLVDLLVECARSLPADAKPAGFTISAPGLVDKEASVLLNAPNLGWNDVPLVDDLMELIKDSEVSWLPRPTIGNEANLGAIAVAFKVPGAPSKFDTFAYISGGIGVGAALIINHELRTGQHGWAGEIGHLTVDPNGRQCRCGSNGCLERYVGREALEPALEAGNDEQLQESARALGIAVATAVNLIDVSKIVLGGPIAQLLERSRDTVEEVLHLRAMAARRSPVALLESPAGYDAPAVGAAYHALKELIDAPATFLTR